MNRWSRAYWIDLGERVGATFIAALIPLYVATANAFAIQWPHVLELAASAAGLSLLKGLLANLASPGSGPSAIPAPPAPEVEPAGDTPDPAAKVAAGYIPDPAALGSGSPSGGTLNPAARADQAAPRTLVRVIPRTDPRLGRHVEHDPRSRGFARPTTVDKSTWRTKTIRIYDPTPNPNQPNGCCTGVAKCIEFNAAGDRKPGKVLGLTDAETIYSLATTLDTIPGYYKPGDPNSQDTGSSGLAAAKAAQKLGLGGPYYWLFGGADEVVQAIMDGDVVNLGTRWDRPMFQPDKHGIVHPDPSQAAGAHEWAARAYDKARDLVGGRCWWGTEFRDFWISRTDLDALLADQGDAHVQARAV